MIKQTLNKGFTLIELLVVIAIIGILASVVLASLNSARDKGADAAIKSNLNNARAQAELFYDTNGNYTNVCATGTSTVYSMYQGAQNAGGTNPDCKSSATTWAMNMQLKSSTNYYCVDGSGQATTTSSDTISTASDYSC